MYCPTIARIIMCHMQLLTLQVWGSVGARAGLGVNYCFHTASLDRLFTHADNTLNLDCLLIQIQAEITPNWYEFGEALGLEKKVLDKCAQYPPEQSIIEVCDHWLRDHSGQPTWREVANALKRINFQQLAFDIEKVYATGILTMMTYVAIATLWSVKSLCGMLSTY